MIRNGRAAGRAVLAALGLVACSYVDPDEPYFLLPDEDFESHEIETLRRVAASFNLEFGTQISVVDEEADGQLRRVVRNDPETCARGAAGRAGALEEIFLCEDRTKSDPQLFQVTRHEIGHTFGIGHVSQQGSVMFGDAEPTSAIISRHFSPADRQEMADRMDEGGPAASCDTVRWWGYTTAAGSWNLVLSRGASEKAFVAVPGDDALALRSVDLRSGVRGASGETVGLPDVERFMRTRSGRALARVIPGENVLEFVPFRTDPPRVGEVQRFPLPDGPSVFPSSIAEGEEDLFVLRALSADRNAWQVVHIDRRSGVATRLHSFFAAPFPSDPQITFLDGRLVISASVPDRPRPDSREEEEETALSLVVFEWDGQTYREAASRTFRAYAGGELEVYGDGLLMALNPRSRRADPELKFLEVETLELSSESLPLPEVDQILDFNVFQTPSRTAVGIIGRLGLLLRPLATRVFVAALAEGDRLESDWQAVSIDDDLLRHDLRLISTGERWLAAWTESLGLPQLAVRARCGRW